MDIRVVELQEQRTAVVRERVAMNALPSSSITRSAL
jgi:hypothetical protein